MAPFNIKEMTLMGILVILLGIIKPVFCVIPNYAEYNLMFPLNGNPNVPQNGNPIIPLNGNAIIPLNGNAIIPLNGNPIVPLIGNPIVPQNGNLIVPLNGNPIVPLNRNPIVPQNGNPIIPFNGNPIIPLNGNPIVPLNGNPIIPLNGNPIVPQNGNPIVPPNNQIDVAYAIQAEEPIDDPIYQENINLNPVAQNLIQHQMAPPNVPNNQIDLGYAVEAEEQMDDPIHGENMDQMQNPIVMFVHHPNNGIDLQGPGDDFFENNYRRFATDTDQLNQHYDFSIPTDEASRHQAEWHRSQNTSLPSDISSSVLRSSLFGSVGVTGQVDTTSNPTSIDEQSLNQAMSDRLQNTSLHLDIASSGLGSSLFGSTGATYMGQVDASSGPTSNYSSMTTNSGFASVVTLQARDINIQPMRFEVDPSLVQTYVI